MLGDLTLQSGLYSHGYQLHKRKHTKPLCLHEHEGGGGIPGGKLRGSYQGKEAGGNPGRVQGLLCALTRPETPEDTSLAEPQSRSGAEGGRRAELGKLSMLEGQEGPDATGND